LISNKKDIVSPQALALKFYEGYKPRERPSAIIMGDKEIKIKKIIWQKRLRDYKTGAQREIFLCETANSRLKLTILPGERFIIEFID
jgi:hypothetical protein